MQNPAAVLSIAIAATLLLSAGAAAQRVSMSGFSVEKPGGAEWLRLRSRGNMVSFRRRVPGTTVSIIAFGRTLKGRVTGWAGLEDLARRLTRTTDGSRGIRRQLAGGKCVFKRFRRPARSRSTEARFILMGADLYCLHPRTGQTVHLGFSQRYAAGASGATTDVKMVRFFNSRRFR